MKTTEQERRAIRAKCPESGICEDQLFGKSIVLWAVERLYNIKSQHFMALIDGAWYYGHYDACYLIDLKNKYPEKSGKAAQLSWEMDRCLDRRKQHVDALASLDKQINDLHIEYLKKNRNLN